jgi:phosphate-selective porin OprO/OprP
MGFDTEGSEWRLSIEPLPPPAKPFGLPDVPQSVVDRTSVQSRWFTLKFGLVTLVDYTAFSQDADSVAQVGTQESQWDARSLRLMLRGTVGSTCSVRYLVAGEYKGFESDPDNVWNITDVSMTFTLGGPATTLTVGKTKETFAYEMVGDAASLAQQERVLSPFFVSRNVGAKLARVFGANHRMTLAGGVFDDWWVNGESHEDSGTDVSARLTGLAWDQPDGRRFLHLGLSGRCAGADTNALRYKGRPESNVADNYVDTGNIASDHAWHLGLEGPISASTGGQPGDGSSAPAGAAHGWIGSGRRA